MKYGKSLLLGELISAEQVDYEDVRKNRFWIVCPVCNEAVFKVVPQTEDSGVEAPDTLTSLIMKPVGPMPPTVSCECAA